MIKNYLKTALRSVWRNKIYSFLNIAGLAIGLSSSLLILSFLKQEISFDKFHKDADQIYRVGHEVSLGTGTKVIASSSHRLAPNLQTDFTELEGVIHFSRIFESEILYDGKKFNESEISFVDSAFFEFFNFELTSGNPATVVLEPNKAVVSESFAKKVFGDRNPIGEVIQVNNPYASSKINVEIGGIMKDMPFNSHFHMQLMISMATGNQHFPESLYSMWGWDSGYTYVKLPKTMSQQTFADLLLDFGQRHIGDESWFVKFFCQPMTSIHLDSNYNSEIEANGSKTYVLIFFFVALIIIVLASVNYMNLATARAINRGKEVGVRKTAGAMKNSLILQFLLESVSITFISFTLAIFIALVAGPWLNEISGKDFLSILMTDYQLWGFFVGITFLVGLISGSYPAFYLSSFKPIAVLKGSVSKKSSKAEFLRKGLVTFQFVLSISLIVGTIIVYKQLHFLRTKELGANTDNVILLRNSPDISNNIVAFKNEVQSLAGVELTSSSNRRFGRDINSGTFFETDNENEVSEARLSMIWADYDFLTLYNIQIKTGRNFSRDIPADTSGAVILNQAALKALDLDDGQDVIGKEVRAMQHYTARIVGTVEDIHFEQLYNEIKPMVFILSQPALNYTSIRLSQGADIQSTLSGIENAWKRFDQDREFAYTFLDESLANTYSAEEKFLSLFFVFNAIAILIACLGVFGLASFTASQRAKEMGIRKVLGASSFNLSFLLTNDFLKLVLIANIFAWPLAYWGLNLWLQNFAYATQFVGWEFLVAGILAAIVSLLTVSFQSIKAATTNPVNILKDE